jgi:uncharacterized delta-60 repeat protein
MKQIPLNPSSRYPHAHKRVGVKRRLGMVAGLLLTVNAAVAAVTVDSGFNPNVGGTVFTSLIDPSTGKIVIGGGFTTVSGSSRQRVARINTDGSLDTSFGDPYVNYVVNAVVRQSTGKIIIGGDFTGVYPQSRRGIARLNTDGTLDTTFTDPGLNGAVRALWVLSDDKILVGGSFTSPNSYLLRLNANGSVDSGFYHAPNNTVVSIAVRDSLCYIGGYFTTVGGTSRGGIARMNANTSLDTGFDPVGANSVVYSIAPSAAHDIFLGGAFTTLQGNPGSAQSRAYMGSFETTGILTGFTGSYGASNAVHVVVDDGSYSDFLIAGLFRGVNSSVRKYIARVSAGGTVDSGFDAGEINNDIQTISVQSDGSIIIGGNFTSVQGVTRNCLARLNR